MGRIGFAFLLGVCGVHTLAALPAPAWAIALSIAIVLAGAARATAACALLVGIAWAWGAAAVRLADDLPATLEGVDIEVRGYVASLPDESPDPQFLFDVVDAPAGVPGRIRLAWYRAPQTPWPGELWRLTVRLKRRNGFANPGGFDYEAHLFRQGVGASGYVRDEPAPERLHPPGFRYPIAQMRAWIARRLSESLRGDPMLGIVQGLAIGDTQTMPYEQWRVFVATGTIHLMAISGLHISMVAALFAWAGGAVVRCRGAQARGWSALHGQVLAGGGAALAYSALAGMSIPTQRTLIMLCIYFAARWLRRELSVGHALGLALIGVLLVDPFAPLAVGAWLSFGAVAVILLAVSGRLARDGLIVNFARVQCALTIGLTPLLLGAFGSVSLISPFANAVAVPLFTALVTPVVLLGAFAATISPSFGAFVLAAPAWLLNQSWPLFEWLAQQPFAIWRFPQPAPLLLTALIAGAALLLLPGFWPTRFAGALLCAPLVFYQPPSPARGDFDFVVLDVGQGLAAVVHTQSHVLVYDAGPAFRSGRDAGEMALLPYLYHRGVRRVDMLMISHGDLDHRGGVKSLVAEIPVGATLRGPSVQAGLVESRDDTLCRRGQRWVWDDVEFEVLHPTSGAGGDNNSSCVLRIQGRGGAALLTGDIEADAEGGLVAAGIDPVDVVVAPHHGSRTSSTSGFVAGLQPEVAVFAVGYRNRWGFPKREVVERWHAAGARTFDTARSGALEMSIASGRPLVVREYRRTHARYWRRR